MFIIAGNPIDGITLIGPFEDDDSLNTYADNNLRLTDWWVITPESPEEDA